GGRDARLAQCREGALEPAARRRAARVLVDDVALARLVDRRDHRHAQGPFLRPPLQGVDQALARDRLVRDHEDMALCAHRTGTCSTSCVRSPLKTAWRAPGTPYSYGVPLT